MDFESLFSLLRNAIKNLESVVWGAVKNKEKTARRK
jgi:hypothetical protein